MSYIKELRARVGSRPLLYVGAGVVAVNEAGELLMFRRTDNGQWDFPGGGMELGESAEETARRELREETGLEVRTLELLEVCSGPEMFYRYPNGDEVYTVAVIYTGRGLSGTLQGNDEAKELRFFAPHATPEELFGPARRVLTRYRQLAER